MAGISTRVFVDAKQKAQAALQNEHLTRIRVTELEKRVHALEGFVVRMTLRQRLRWLLQGK